MKKALVTGATGFIGNALCSELIDNGWEVTILIREESLEKRRPKCTNKLIFNLDNLDKLPHQISDKYDVFYHFAWNGANGEKRENFELQESNIRYTANAVKVAAALGCKRFIGAGSQAEYGVVNEICNEEHYANPFMMYGAAKLSAYHMGKLVASKEEIEFVWPRIYSVYGVGENSDTLVSYLISALTKGETPQLSECENTWDFIYIDDCVKALRLLGEKENVSGIYNIASGYQKKLREFVEEIRDVVNPEGKLEFGAKFSNPLRTFQLKPNVSRISALGFKPEVSIKEGIKRRMENSLI